MPVYLYWGEDDFAIERAVAQIRQQVIDPQWEQFNFDKFTDSNGDSAISALNQAVTPPFGMGGRLVWLTDTQIANHCAERVLAELERTLPAIPANVTLLLTTFKKIDKRLKSTKLLQKYAEIKEFGLIPPWKPDLLLKQTQQAARDVGVKLTPAALELLAESVGNQSRQLWNELEKLALFADSQSGPLDVRDVERLVNATSQTSLQLAKFICRGDVNYSLLILQQLLNRNEPALKIVATLVGQFRTWTLVKVMTEARETDQAIASLAGLGNPKRIYFLKKEITKTQSSQFLAALPLLMNLELNLKQGSYPTETLQTKIIELCGLFSQRRST
ncbi:MAG: DNA polymerase III subunit delta [Cyanobacteria bacterium P01_H01_bin.15]